MGTNYYLTRDIGFADSTAEAFGLGGDLSIHIGKRSYGWRFMFRAHVNRVESYNEWATMIDNAIDDGWEVTDEYGERVDDFICSVVNATRHKSPCPEADFQDDGWPFFVLEFC